MADFKCRMRVAAREAEVDRGDAVMDKLHIGRVGEHADLGAALQRQAGLFRGAVENGDEGGVRNRAVKRAASMEAIEAHARATAKRKVATSLHVRRVGREH